MVVKKIDLGYNYGLGDATVGSLALVGIVALIVGITVLILYFSMR